MTVLMVCSEAVPFAKSGGLGDAVPALARALSEHGHDVGLLMPRYYSVDRRRIQKLAEPLGVPVGGEDMWCGVYKTRLPGSRVPVWMLDREDLFGRQGLYGPDGSQPWPDNALRYAFLSLAAFQLSRYLHRIPDILHLHDWQAAPAAWLLKHWERHRGFEKTASVLTIHNLGYQGNFPAPESLVFPPASLEQGRESLLWEGEMNYLAAGIDSADAINTVSPTYAEEILLPEYSHGLDDVLSSNTDKITGILNGMDYTEWNPARDKTLKPFNYSRGSLWKKAKLKARLQNEAGLPMNSAIPLFGMVTRLTGQKGVDLMAEPSSPALEEFRGGRAQLVLLGTGERRYEEALKNLGKDFPKSCSVRIGFSEPYSRLIEAGSDFFLMPSRYEPCGLNQMYSLRYGALPVVRRTGGLADTIADMDEHPDSGSGFVFDRLESQDFGDAVKRAAAFYENKKKMKAARKRAMRVRFDWNLSSRGYEAMYKNALRQISRRSLVSGLG